MSRKPLPQPVSPSERLLHDIATSLRQMCGDNVTDLPAGTVQLQEPAQHACACGKTAKSAAGLAAHRRHCEAA